MFPSSLMFRGIDKYWKKDEQLLFLRIHRMAPIESSFLLDCLSRSNFSCTERLLGWGSVAKSEDFGGPGSYLGPPSMIWALHGAKWEEASYLRSALPKIECAKKTACPES